MTDEPLLLLVCGSLRKESRNAALLNEAARLFGPARIERADLRLPLYDGDLEAQGIPPEVMRLVEQFRRADAAAIATPEYNKNLSGVLKNALDWISRVKPQPLLDKPVAIMSAAAGRSGGERSQFSLRHCLTPFQPRVLQGPEVLIANCDQAFDEDGRLKDDQAQALLRRLMNKLRAEIALRAAQGS
ncbi:NADPH-dependent FMN reductase [Oceanicella actignis]|uniref:NADPH-dependent FMN reductase n=1 Tax=Oceanicella actignis TaxID=1189325 RepID=UPI0011E82D22|nr:NAD(P)H-dependent oxidoreductase [Oceanicella actignis]TYO88473.1 chromate reductase [Oceanicella actignis]